MTTGMEAVVDRAGDELSNNLFTDLAPLLSLFGERFAQQYMSRSRMLSGPHYLLEVDLF